MAGASVSSSAQISPVNSDDEFVPLVRHNSDASTGSDALGTSSTTGQMLYSPPASLQRSQLGSTSNSAGDGALPVTLWEDPFLEYSRDLLKHAIEDSSIHGGHGTRGPAHVHHRAPSSGNVSRSATPVPVDVSHETPASGIPGVGMFAHDAPNAVNAFKYLVHLPFRTIVITNPNEPPKQCDQWNNAEDPAWEDYCEVLSVSKLHKEQKKARNDQDDLASTTSESSMVDIESAMYGNADEYDPDDPDSHNTGNNKRRQRLFIVCFHLPVKLSKNDSNEWNVSWTESLIAKTDDVLKKSRYDVHWIGTVTPPPDIPELSDADKDVIDVCLSKMSCTPIYLPKQVKQAHYLGMCKQVLWPMFHNVDLLDLSTSGWGQRDLFFNAPPPSATANHAIPMVSAAQASVSDWDQSRLAAWWDAYQTTNRAFAAAVRTSLKAGDTLWIHDYHLSLLPKYVHEADLERFKARKTKMVMFLHIPFPTSQIFRELECGEQILEGMLHADVVGFHAFDHARHFLNAGKRILGLNYESLVGGLIGMRYQGRLVLITLSNVSIEATKVKHALSLNSVDMELSMLKDRHPHRIMICGMDVAQRLSGVSSKLLAYERLLTDYPSWQSKVVLVQLVHRPNNRQVDELTTVRELRFLVNRIQEQFGPHVIDYQEILGSELPLVKRLSYWLASDVFLSTPIREGLNLLPLEYVYARHANSAAGVTIVSEFGACSSILNGALRVNPYDIQTVALSIDKALTMGTEEREGRVMRDIEFISTCPSSKWTKNVLRDLHEVTTAMKETTDDSDDEEVDVTSSDALDSIGTFLQRESDIRFSHVNHDAIRAAYLATSKRVLIMDFNGTLVVKEPPGKYLKREILGTSGYKPPTSVLRALTKLAADPCNTVIVVSGDAQENIEAAIGNIPNLVIAASNGACFSLPLKRGETRRTWFSFDLGVDWEAVKQVSLPVLSKYTARTNGSFVKLTHSSLGWSNYSADPEWGAMQASHLVLEMQHALSKFDVRFVTLKGVVEVVPRRLNKGLIVKKVLREVAARKGGDGVDFCICMGDDVSDEKMFAAVYSFFAELNEDYLNVVPSPAILGGGAGRGHFLMHETPSLQIKNTNEPMYAFTIAVGKKPSHASQYVDDARDVAHVLNAMTGDRNVPTSSRNLSWDMEELGGIDFFS